jgi:hypothetical protein
VQDFRARYPSFEERSERLPPLASPLTRACEEVIPQPVDALPEVAQLSKVPGQCVVLETSKAIESPTTFSPFRASYLRRGPRPSHKMTETSWRRRFTLRTLDKRGRTRMK